MAGARVPKYDWTAMLAPVLDHRQTVTFIEGEDFSVAPESFRQQLRAAARSRGVDVLTSRLVDRVVVRPLPPPSYDWDMLFDGRIYYWTLTDFRHGVAGFRVTISRAAAKREVTYRTKQYLGSFYLQARTRGGVDLPKPANPIPIRQINR